LAKAHAVFEIVVGVISGFFFVIMVILGAALSSLGHNDATLSGMLLACGTLLVGPVLMVIGSSLFLRGSMRKLGAVLNLTGALAWTGLTIYLAASVWNDPLHRPSPLQFLSIVLLCVSVLVDWAAYSLWRSIR
jgi:hypothetical protein